MDDHPAPAAMARRAGWLGLLMTEAGVIAGCSGLLDPARLEGWRTRLHSTSWVVTRPALVVTAAALLIGLACRPGGRGRRGVLIGPARRFAYASVAHLI